MQKDPQLNTSAIALSKVEGSYGAEKLQKLEGMEAVRKHPGWYIGGKGSVGLHHCVYEIVDNSVDEALAGYCTEINIIIHLDNSITVIDDGRGIPVGMHPEYKIPGVELVYTNLHAGGKFNEEDGAYKVSGGLHGVGAAAVNALSKRLKIRVKDGSQIHQIEFSCGAVTHPLSVVGQTSATGTQVTFKLDNTIFELEEFNYVTLANRFREMAFLNRGLKITIKDERTDKEESFQYKGGLKEFITWLNRSKTPIHSDIVHIFQAKDDYEVEIAIQWTDSYNMSINSYANAIATTDGGTHVAGFKTAITRSLNTYIKDNDLLKNEKMKLTGDDIREGLTAIISIKLPELLFDSQMKSKLVNSEVEGIVSSLAGDGLKTFLEENPKIAKAIVNKALTAASAREAAKRARALTRKKSNFGGGIPEKMASCQSKTPEECEIYIVEGDSAGGSAKQARDRKYQAVLPLRGKILNVEKARYDKILANNEIKTFIQALGAGVGKDEFDIDKVRYHKIIIMTDADIDGSHIRTLILTLVYRQFLPLVEKGYLYIAQPPLYRYEKGRIKRYLKDEKALGSFLITSALDGAAIEIDDASITEEEIVSKVNDYVKFTKLLKSYDTHFDTPLLAEIIKNPLINQDLLKDKAALESQIELLSSTLNKEDSHRSYSFEIMSDAEEVEYCVRITVQTLARTKKFFLRSLFLESVEFQDLRDSFDSFQHINDGKFTYKKGKVEENFQGMESFVEFILEEGKRGAYIQRYKGLGEMNADQLWETTMDPANRRLLQVQLTDTAESDQVFSILMGNKVEPRREFVEENALNVRNLDV
jgi:DNA gyrase subunit B